MPSTPPNWGAPPWTISFHPKQKPLPDRVDFAIVGAGFSGLSAAVHLKRLAPKKSVIVLESGALGAGSSGHTGGMALAETAAGPLPGLGDVLAGYKKILRDLHISAELNLPGVWELARGKYSMEGKEVHSLRNSPIDWSDSGRLRAVNKVPGGTVNPGKVISGLARAAEKFGASIFEQTNVLRLQSGTPLKLHLNHNGKKRTIEAHRVLLATNAASLELTALQRSAEAHLTFALATEPLKKSQLKALGLASGKPFYTVDFPYLWGRLTQNNSVIFGAGLVTSKNWRGLHHLDVRRGQPADRLRWLENRVQNLHPVLKNVRITHRWAGPILFTQKMRPVFRHHLKSRSAIILSGFNGHGVALSVYLGKWAAQSLLNKRSLPNWSPRQKSRKRIVR
ncbi:MAG TPA: FAD-binding oxidoreductase [Candidatus Sulfotelmatobacter sp.]|jgi:glycine/D-amino acid oxidase-like deaminating enzyme|nr:FAD-binding oxidoreductase [Candidatus Sulfotelmatobacter sp.]